MPKGVDPKVARLIRKLALAYGIDVQAALRVAAVEGGIRWGGVGDNGTSYGPYQLHEGGALPKGKGAKWANSPEGLEYAIRQMSKVAKGLKGDAAIEAIVRKFERPANPDAEIARALGVHIGNIGGGAGGGSPSLATPAQQPPDMRAAVIQTLMQNVQQFTQTGQAGMNPNQLLGLAMARQAIGAADKADGLPGPGAYNGRGLLGKKYQMGGGPDAHGQRPLGNWQSDHAWDLMAPAGTAVYAPANSTVKKVHWSDNGKTVWGYQVTLAGSGNEFFLTHLGKLNPRLKPGKKVKKGQLIGWLGDPPYFAPHLHIGLLHGGLEDYL